MNFFVHPDFHAAAVELLRAFGGDMHQFELCADAYAGYKEDAEWITLVGKPNPKQIVLALGDSMLKNRVHKKLLQESGCCFVCFGNSWLAKPWEQQAWRYVKYWPSVIERLSNLERPAALEINWNGSIERIPL